MMRLRSRFASTCETISGGTLRALALGALLVSCRGPGAAPQVKELQVALEARGFAAETRAAFDACGKTSLSCACTERLATVALDAGLPRATADFLERAEPSCAAELGVRGLVAEALAYSDRLEDAERKAASVLEARPEEKHALLARARAAFLRGALGEAFALVERASGRGAPADLLRGEIAQGLGRYRDAREAYLKAVASPLAAREARFRLALMTARAGARAEAEHHLAKLTTLGGVEEARMKQLRSAVAAAAPSPSAAIATER
jgi:tetratricopeptide (TPR) repeat protein